MFSEDAPTPAKKQKLATLDNLITVKTKEQVQQKQKVRIYYFACNNT